jgi:hypothetical protein
MSSCSPARPTISASSAKRPSSGNGGPANAVTRATVIARCWPAEFAAA